MTTREKIKAAEEKALPRGISERKHREMAERVWLAKRNQSSGWEQPEQLYAPPSQHPIYKTILQAIMSHQGRTMQTVVCITTASCLTSFAQENPREMIVLQFVVEELIEKGWTSSQLRYEPLASGGNVLLVCDFTL
jgi:hypothetical protein